MMQDPEDSRRSLESEVSTTVDTTATPEKGPNLESQFLRQSSQSSQKNEYYMRDTSSVSSANSGGGGGIIRSPSTTSVGTDQRAKKRRNPNAVAYTATTLNYHGVNIYQACAEGNLPVVVLLWGMASSKRVTLIDRDFQGNNPMHYAAMAGNTEVIGFLMQQTKGQFTEEERLINSRNRMGETPLLKAMNMGVTPVIKALIDESADLLVTDYQGNTVFTILAKCGHLWALNYIYQIICNVHGPQVALELMSLVDNEAHTPLEWAADTGDVNIMEFFMRKGLSPYRRDPLNRTALFWAVKSGRIAAARFLVKCGCDVDLVDTTGQSPLKIAQQCKNTDLLHALEWKGISKEAKTIRSAYKDLQTANDSTHSYEPNLTPPLFSTHRGAKQSHAIEQRNLSSGVNVLIFGAIVLILWLLTLIVPFYVWLCITCLAIMYHRYLDKDKHREVSDNSRGQTDQNRPSTLKAFLRAPEKGLGLWLGSMIMYLLYLLSATIDEYYHSSHKHVNNIYTEGAQGFHTLNPLDLGGNSFVRHDFILYLIVCGLFVTSTVLWVKLVWFNSNPGIIDTRDQNFDEIMAQSFAVAGSPPPALFCRTTLVKKPIRSKYCTRTGCVVARMDHHCVWLNMTVGDGNHRTFMLFLISQLLLCLASLVMLLKSLHREIPIDSACLVLTSLLAGNYFFVAAFVGFLALMSFFLLALVFEQTMNIAGNITTNERINHAHYYWMVDNDGTLCNKFDRGVLFNLFEFCHVPGFGVDYSQCFELPTLSAGSKYTLTQENIMRYSNTSNAHLLPSEDLEKDRFIRTQDANNTGMPPFAQQRSDRTFTNSIQYFTNSSRAGPPSIDLEMTKMRGSSMDSADTYGSAV